MRDYDGKTAFTLMIETPNADIECLNELLLNSLPIDPLSEEWVPPEGTPSPLLSSLLPLSPSPPLPHTPYSNPRTFYIALRIRILYITLSAVIYILD